MLKMQNKGNPENWKGGNPPRWLTWTSPRIRINWWKRQRWRMSAMQRGIILSKHGSSANTQAYTHMLWVSDKSIETSFSGCHCASFWAERRECRLKLVDHKVYLSNSLHIEMLDSERFLSVQCEFCLISCDFWSWETFHKLLASSTMSPTVQRVLTLEVNRCLDNLDARKIQ